MRIWHNIGCEMDVVEYIEGRMYGIISYKEGMPRVLENRTWLATMWDYDEVMGFVDWCDMRCDKEIYNRITKKDSDNEWT